MEQPFDKPLDKWIEEKEEVEKVNHYFDPKTGRIESKREVELETFKVRYEKSKIDTTFCAELQHTWHVVDSHLYMVKCRKCPYMKRIMPGLEYIDPEGHIRLRDNDSVIA